MLAIGKNAKINLIVTALFGAMAFTVCSGTPVQAQSLVAAQVCQLDAQATLSVSEPPSDTVVQTRQIVVRGTVELISQIEASIDGQYVKTVAIPIGGEDYQLPLTLAVGTNTISLAGENICDGTRLNQTILITYQPPPTPSQPAPPSRGSEVPTVSNPNVIAPGGIIVSPPDDSPTNPADQPSQAPESAGWLDRLRQWLAEWPLVRVESGGQSASSSLWLAIISLVFGLVLATTGRWLPTKFGWLSKSNQLSRRAIDLGLRSLGVVLIIVSLIW